MVRICKHLDQYDIVSEECSTFGDTLLVVKRPFDENTVIVKVCVNKQAAD